MFRVLTIIDNPAHKKSLLRVLQKIGLKVIDCQRKYASFLRLVQYVPHLILFESGKLSIEDLRLIQLIRKNSLASSIPIIFIGPKLDEDRLEVITSYGINEYFSTPVDIKRLAITVKQIEKESHDKTREELGIEVNQLSRNEEKIILNRRELLSRKLDIMEKHVHKLLAFPTTVVQLIKKSEDGISGAKDLAKIVESDSAVAAEVLKLANSVHFATSGKRTTSLRDAIVRIGLEQTKSIVVSMSVMQNITDDNYQTGFNHNEYWSHSLAVAIISGMIAKKSSLVNSDEAFVFGLLHELGIFLYNEYLNNFFLMLLDKSTEMGFPFSFFQQELMAMSHNDLMVRLCDRWNFPNSFTENFKALDTLTLNSETLHTTPLAFIATVADIIAHMLRLGRGADCCVESIPIEVLFQLKLTTSLDTPFYAKIFETFNLYNMVLNLDQQDFQYRLPLMIDNDLITLAILESDTHWSPLYTYLKNEGYKVEKVFDESELLSFLEKDENALFIITAYDSRYSSIVERCKLCSYRGIVFDDTQMVSESYSTYGIIITNYPVDLRNVDMVIHAICLNLFGKEMTGRIGTLLPVRDTQTETPNFMVVHPDREIQIHLEKSLHKAGFYKIESVLDGDKAINIARTAEVDFDYILVGLNSTVVDAIDIILEIKRLPHHKRAKFILLYRGERPNFITLEKFSKAGVIRLLKTDGSNIDKELSKLLGTNDHTAPK